ncbi:MAG: hypothetical protein ABIZ34_01365 [Candidatus Limnocylindrales bacterium]
MTLKLYRPDDESGGLEPAKPGAEPADWREGLRSRRWDPAPIQNPDVKETSPLMGILFFAALAALTFVILLLGYWGDSPFWG